MPQPKFKVGEKVHLVRYPAVELEICEIISNHPSKDATFYYCSYLDEDGKKCVTSLSEKELAN